MRKIIFSVLLILILIGLFLFYQTMQEDSSVLPSALINQPLPKSLNLKKGRWYLINFWASWCENCVTEIPFLQQHDFKSVTTVGVRYKDPKNILPHFYQINKIDLDGKMGMDMGVYGVPESFLIDPNGIVKVRHAGAINDTIWADEFQPLIENRAVYQKLIYSLRCVVCQNQSLAESNAPLAADLRRVIQDKLLEGQNENDIKKFMTARYGEFVLLQPEMNWYNLTLWVAPIVILILGLGLSIKLCYFK